MNPLTFLALLLAASIAEAADLPGTKPLVERDFPSIFQAWNGATPLPGKDATAMLALHHLAFLSPSQLGLQWEGTFAGTATNFTSASLAAARTRRAGLM